MRQRADSIGHRNTSITEVCDGVRKEADAGDAGRCAKAVNGFYKTELIRQRGPWRTVEQVELTTFEYVWWWNNQRLHSELGYRTPIEVETAYYAGLKSPVMATASHAKP